ncbi:uncharacterized protein LOC117644782 [Thrips palmi]|uniref:Gustatory receptor n=1 Tax=Thrips palmi TaxID=161013 RepID=A0A6P8YT73_THRPL|nr:uncharacterized protein LOC117644782 [Thrips palmi]
MKPNQKSSQWPCPQHLKPKVWPGYHPRFNPSRSPTVATIAWPPSPPGSDEEPDDHPSDVLAYDPALLKNNALASTVVVMAFMGVMPVLIKTKRFCLRSTLPLCMLAYAALWCSALHILVHKVPVALAGDLDMDVRMLAIEVSVHLVPLCYVPVVWLQSRNISRITVAYFKFRSAIMSPADRAQLGRRRLVYALCTSVFAGTAIALVVGAALFVPELHVTVVDIPVLAYTNLVQTVLWWNMAIQLLQSKVMGQSVLANLQKLAGSGAVTAAAVRANRGHWVRVRDMLGYDDVKANAVYVLNMVYLLAQCTMVSFETMSFYSAGNRWAYTMHGVFAVIYLLEICTLCDFAHRAVELMTDPFVATLDTLSLNDLDRETHTEVCFFYNTIIAKRPYCSIRGFACLDRPFLASIITTIVSYLIFLAQFRAEDEEDELVPTTTTPL